MREILFRGKRKDNGEWVEGFYFCMVHDDGSHVHHFIMPLGADLSLGTPIEKIQVEIDIETLCQYTGLTDKNGNNIWENDVVKKHFYTDYDAYANSEEYVGFVKYEDFAWVIKSPKSRMIRTFPIIEAIAYSKDVKHFEIIGNTFDNADLLKGE